MEPGLAAWLQAGHTKAARNLFIRRRPAALPAADWAAHPLHLLNQPQPNPQAPPAPNPARLRLALPLTPPQSFADFATGLIAPKPVKPCDRAVFRAFYLLLFLQWNRACGLASSGPHESSPQPFHSAPPHLPRRHARCRLGGPSAPSTQSAAAKSATMSSTKPGYAPACTDVRTPAVLRPIRYRFDSTQARQTVR